MAKILVADDEADLEMLIKQKFRRQIRENKYEFIFALNGRDALEKMQHNADVDIVLSDINMPEMGGLTLLVKLKEQNPLVKTVIVSAYGDIDNIRTAMNRGAFDFVCKPVNFEDLEVTIEKAIHSVVELKETLQAIKENWRCCKYGPRFSIGRSGRADCYQRSNLPAGKRIVSLQ